MNKILQRILHCGIIIIYNVIFRPEEYKKKVSEYVRKYASEEALRQNGGGDGVSSSSESSMSDYSEDEAQVIYILT